MHLYFHVVILLVFLSPLSRALGGVLLWMEISFDAGIVENYLDLQSVVNATGTTEENVSAAVIDLRTFERFRYIQLCHSVLKLC